MVARDAVGMEVGGGEYLSVRGGSRAASTSLCARRGSAQGPEAVCASLEGGVGGREGPMAFGRVSRRTERRWRARSKTGKLVGFQSKLKSTASQSRASTSELRGGRCRRALVVHSFTLDLSLCSFSPLARPD